MSNQQEEWKLVPSCPGMSASSLGRIRVLPYQLELPAGGVRTYQVKPTMGYLRRSFKTARHKYRGLWLRKYGNIKVHRMVCEAFYGTAPTATSIVIHINEDSTDNRASNLKWGTQRENLNMPGFISYCKSRTGSKSPVVKGRLKKESNP